MRGVFAVCAVSARGHCGEGDRERGGISAGISAIELASYESRRTVQMNQMAIRSRAVYCLAICGRTDVDATLFCERHSRYELKTPATPALSGDVKALVAAD